MLKAYCLIDIPFEKIEKTIMVSGKLKKMNSVTSVETVTGLYDFVAIIKAPNFNALDRIVNRIRKIDGVSHTTTLITVSNPTVQ